MYTGSLQFITHKTHENYFELTQNEVVTKNDKGHFKKNPILRNTDICCYYLFLKSENGNPNEKNTANRTLSWHSITVYSKNHYTMLIIGGAVTK